MAMMTALIDSSSAILLHKAGVFDSLTSGYRPIMASSVFRELTVKEHAGAAEFVKRSENGSIIIRATEEPGGISRGPVPLKGTMGEGERDTILLYHEYTGGFVIIDDRKGARFCRESGIPYVNAILMSRVLFLSGIIHRDLYDLASGFLRVCGRYSPSILGYAESCGREEIEHFIARR